MVSVLLMAVFSNVSNISKATTASQDNLLQSLFTLTVRRVYLTFKRNLLHFNLCPLLLDFSLRGVWLHLLSPSHQMFLHTDEMPPEPPPG